MHPISCSRPVACTFMFDHEVEKARVRIGQNSFSWTTSAVPKCIGKRTKVDPANATCMLQPTSVQIPPPAVKVGVLSLNVRPYAKPTRTGSWPIAALVSEQDPSGSTRTGTCRVRANQRVRD